MKFFFFLKPVLIVCFFLNLCAGLQAQQTDVLPPAKQKDLVDLLHSVLKHKNNAAKTADTTSKGLHLSIVPAVGYTLQNGFLASLSSNASFYTGGSKEQNISAVNSILSVTQKNQFIAGIQSNIWAAQNRRNWVGDYRFLIYPQSTYGLGGQSRVTDESLLKYKLIRFVQSVYFKTKNEVYVGVGYQLNYHYGIQESESMARPESDFQSYDGKSQTTSSGISLNLLLDERRNLNNPVAGGQYLNVQLLNNLKALGSMDNWQSLVMDARKYIGVGSRKRNKLAVWTYGWFTFNNHAPYLDLPATGWDMNGNLGRGYVQGRFRGKNLLYAETEYRMAFTRNGLLGGVLFANAQSFTNWPSNRFTTVQPATGAGIRIKFNKYANTNIALDYAIGKGGSKGLFVNLGEVF